MRQESPPLPAWVPTPGTVIADKYEIERVLGAGGMGVVVAARHRQLGQRVAIKFLRAEAIQDGNAVARFLREARASVALSSEHVAKVLDVGTLEAGAPYMIMEYLAGVDLGQVLRQGGPMAVPTAVGTVLQACEALAEAHALGIVHRDLKPANLFVATRRDGSPLIKVLDFGISKAAPVQGREPGQSLTVSGFVMGSPGYMSPEQMRSTKDVDARSDVWSLGVILYELLTGVSPFLGETLGDTFAKIASESPPPIHRPDVPRRLVLTIEQCLERKLDARIQNVAELASRLLPFAPRDAALLVERILRVSGPSDGDTIARSETLAAPEWSGQPPWATERPWFRPGTGSHRPSRRWPRLVFGACLFVLAAAGIAIRYALRADAPSTSAAASTMPSAPWIAPAPPPSTSLHAPIEALSSPTAAQVASVSPIPEPTPVVRVHTPVHVVPPGPAGTASAGVSAPPLRRPRASPKPAMPPPAPGSADYEHF